MNQRMHTLSRRSLLKAFAGGMIAAAVAPELPVLGVKPTERAERAETERRIWALGGLQPIDDPFAAAIKRVYRDGGSIHYLENLPAIAHPFGELPFAVWDSPIYVSLADDAGCAANLTMIQPVVCLPPTTDWNTIDVVANEALRILTGRTRSRPR